MDKVICKDWFALPWQQCAIKTPTKLLTFIRRTDRHGRTRNRCRRRTLTCAGGCRRPGVARRSLARWPRCCRQTRWSCRRRWPPASFQVQEHLYNRPIPSPRFPMIRSARRRSVLYGWSVSRCAIISNDFIKSTFIILRRNFQLFLVAVQETLWVFSQFTATPPSPTSL